MSTTPPIPTPSVPPPPPVQPPPDSPASPSPGLPGTLVVRARRVLRRRWARRSMIALAALLVLIVGVAIGLAGAEDNRDEVEAAERRAADLRERLEEERTANDELDEENAELASQLAELEAEAQDLEDRASALDEREQGLDERSAELDRRAEELEAAEAAAEASSFGDGLYEVGTDIQPGQYRADGGGGCYWARLNSSDTFDIADNHFGPGPQTVEISGGYFETSGCGTWRKAG